MRAARIHAIGQPPRLDDVDPPSPRADDALLQVRAVALNPVDVSIATGVFYGGHPPLPYVLGAEGVGVVEDAGPLAPGTRVYVFGEGLGIARDGVLAERAAAPAETLIALPDSVDDAVAVACGIAGIAGWTATARRTEIAKDDRVLVLGATGTAGSVAVQAARLRGARSVVAVGRRADRLERCRELGVDAAVQLDGRETLSDELVDACGGAPTVVIDFLWGRPVVAASEAAAPGARIVHAGQSAGAEAPLRSAAVRGKQLRILGYSNFALSPDELRDAYLELLEHVADGRIAVDIERYPLDRLDHAWERQTSGKGTKIVVEP